MKRVMLVAGLAALGLTLLLGNGRRKEEQQRPHGEDPNSPRSGVCGYESDATEPVGDYEPRIYHCANRNADPEDDWVQERIAVYQDFVAGRRK